MKKLIQAKPKAKPFFIDATESEQSREIVSKILKQNNAMRGSKFIKPSYSAMGHSYNVSRK